MHRRALLTFGSGAALASLGLFNAPGAIAQDCSLAEPLTLADTQDGFAGQVGTVWTIAPDCSFTIARQLGAKAGDPYRQGRFTAEQKKSFEELLDRTAIADLPAQVGEGPMVNARRVTLSYGETVSVLMLPPGEQDLADIATTLSDGRARDLAALADGVKRLTAE